MKIIQYILLVIIVGFSSCKKDFLEVEPTNKISADAIFSSPEGVQTFMANLYSQLPIEDFNYAPDFGFNYNVQGPNNGGFFQIVMTDDGIGSQHQQLAGWYGVDGGDNFKWWLEAYKLNRDVNMLFEAIPNLSLTETEKDLLLGEANFIRAYIYFALAKRYGGVPIITTIADINDGEGAFYIPRSTEKETWDFVLQSCDDAASLLGETDGTRRRANKWVALSLKSRAALHAASLAKYWDNGPLSGEAVSNFLIGFENGSTDASRYYQACIDASEQIINSGPYSLFEPNPSSPIEAEENYRKMFENPNIASSEAIFIKGYTLVGTEYGGNQDNWGNPAQTTGAWPHPGRFNPTLDLVDIYENYSTPGVSSPVITTIDGDTDNYNGYSSSRSYLKFDDAKDIFADKDARMKATVIMPFSTWKDTEIVIQGGLIKPDGTPDILVGNNTITDNGIDYFSYGASGPSLYSGFDVFGGNMTRTGFGFKKFLNSNYIPILAWNQSTTDFMDFRLAEIMLNYAEAVIESGLGDVSLAEQSINDLRRRAAHTSTIPLTLENVLRERRVELTFENKRYWDLVRRREYHTEFANRTRHGLVPVYDMRDGRYLFVRDIAFHTDPVTFVDKWYYKRIPGVATNKLIQNPQY